MCTNNVGFHEEKYKHYSVLKKYAFSDAMMLLMVPSCNHREELNRLNRTIAGQEK